MHWNYYNFLSSHWLAIWRIFRRSPLSEENYPNRNPAWKQALLIIDFQGNTRTGSSTFLSGAGFSVAYDKKVTNPVVSVSPGHYPVWHKQSKMYTHSVNPKSNFVAVMVCSDADQSCPVVDGASARFSLPYDDPRYFDNTPSQDLKYDETVDLIGREMLFMIGYLKNQLILSEESRK